MKKCLLGLLLVVALVAVSCSLDNAVQDEVVTVSFAKLKARAINETDYTVSSKGTWGTSAVELGTVDTYYWTYKATKGDTGGTKGQVGFTNCATGTGLGGAREFSQGKWTFELKAYVSDAERTAGAKAVFYGTVSVDSLTDKGTVNIPVDYTYVAGTGKAVITITPTIIQSADTSYKVTKITMTIAGKDVNLSEAADTKTWSVTKDGIASGLQTVGIKLYVDNEEAPRYSNENFGTAVIMHGMTTNISASAEVTLKPNVVSVTFTSTLPSTQPSLAVGTAGPGGGYIFYDVDADNNDGTNEGKGADGLTSAELGWKYLQAATTDLEKQTWGPDGSYSTEEGIGTGYANTKKINAEAKTGNMTEAVFGKMIDGGYGWFVPSKAELQLMYDKLSKTDLVTFTKILGYWSSTESTNTTSAWYRPLQKDYNDKLQTSGRDKAICVRPVRYLTASGEPYIPAE